MKKARTRPGFGGSCCFRQEKSAIARSRNSERPRVSTRRSDASKNISRKRNRRSSDEECNDHCRPDGLDRSCDLAHQRSNKGNKDERTIRLSKRTPNVLRG